MTRTGRRIVAWAAGAAIIVGIAGAARLAYVHELSKHPWTHDDEISTWNRNYPKPNDHPKRAVELFGRRPDDLPLRFIARFAASNRSSRCSSWVGFGIRARYLISIEVPTTLSPGSYRATLFPDYFDPGRCDWRLVSVVPWLDNGYYEIDSYEAESGGTIEVAADGTHEPSYARDDADATQRVFAWCTKSGSTNSPPEETCMPFDSAQSFPGKHLAPVNPLPDQRRPMPAAVLYPETRRIEIDFLDLDRPETHAAN